MSGLRALSHAHGKGYLTLTKWDFRFPMTIDTAPMFHNTGEVENNRQKNGNIQNVLFFPDSTKGNPIVVVAPGKPAVVVSHLTLHCTIPVSLPRTLACRSHCESAMPSQ